MLVSHHLDLVIESLLTDSWMKLRALCAGGEYMGEEQVREVFRDSSIHMSQPVLLPKRYHTKVSSLKISQ